jgi:hypothetical protein
MFKFSAPVTKKSPKDGHTYASSSVIVDGVAVGYVVKHSEVLFGVGLPHPAKKGLVWKQFASRDEVIGFLKTNADKALRFKSANSPEEAAQTTFGF